MTEPVTPVAVRTVNQLAYSQYFQPVKVLQIELWWKDIMSVFAACFCRQGPRIIKIQ